MYLILYYGTMLLRTIDWLPALVLLALFTACDPDYKRLAEEYKQQFARLNEEVHQFTKTLPSATDKIDPLALKEIYRDQTDLRSKNEKLQELLASVSHKDLAGAYRVDATYSSANGCVDQSVKIDLLRETEHGSQFIRQLISINGNGTEAAIILGEDVGAGHFLIQRHAMTLNGHCSFGDNVMTYRADVYRHVSDAANPWIRIGGDSLNGQVNNLFSRDPQTFETVEWPVWIKISIHDDAIPSPTRS